MLKKQSQDKIKFFLDKTPALSKLRSKNRLKCR